ncbi:MULTISPECIES: membrane protein [Fusobacterium]|jgi:hypothetical protein|uniref:Uncharacterized protein n=1 Tax=Fusobacterium nucleatum subsp. polymorphum TaxID=76857 RepID=A0A2C5ZDT0_FUSNP|nr:MULTISPECIES: membrane protein [Fusobacterium]EUB26009.1 hypothetical protein HMPREF1500_1681 [Fusobacterium sp. CM22]PHH97569.1 hypothetical protein CA840_09840 [Fusobacterium polymorphum]
MSEKLSNEDNKYLISLIKEEKIVEAVKFVREKTDMSLLEAKKYVDLKRINENAEYSQNDNNISEDEKEYIVSLIQENKKLQAVAFLHKSKNMSLLEAKNYIDNLAPYIEKDMTKINSNSNNISNYKAKEIPNKRGFIFDEKLNIFIPNLARQRKFNKVILYILLLLTVISLIQLPFLDRTSYYQMLFFLFSSVSLLPLLVIWIGVALNIYFTEKTLKELEEVELTNEFEIKSLKENFTFFLFLFVLIFLILVIYLHIDKLFKWFSYRELFPFILIVAVTIYNLYIFYKKLKNRKYSLNINGKNISILYKNNEIDLVKTDNIDCVEFYAKRLRNRKKEIKPTIQIFNKEHKALLEMTISIKNYYLLKKYFTKYNVEVKDDFLIF